MTPGAASGMLWLGTIRPALPWERQKTEQEEEHSQRVLALADPRHALNIHRVHSEKEAAQPCAGNPHAGKEQPKQNRVERVQR